MSQGTVDSSEPVRTRVQRSEPEALQEGCQHSAESVLLLCEGVERLLDEQLGQEQPWPRSGRFVTSNLVALATNHQEERDALFFFLQSCVRFSAFNTS